tara:strand:- start:626 stop:877 length:252 start_codon:yes stop_codon:yes gene_type:complete
MLFRIKLSIYKVSTGALLISNYHFMQSENPCDAQKDVILCHSFSKETDIEAHPVIGSIEYEATVDGYIYRTSETCVVSLKNAY